MRRAWLLVPLVMFAGLAGGAGRADEILVSGDWLEERLFREDVIVVHVGFSAEAPDAKGRAEYEAGHVPGARHLAWSELTASRNGIPNEIPAAEELVAVVRRLGIDGKQRIVLYDTGVGVEAARAYVTLDYLGLGAKASLLDGHWKVWKAEERSISREIPRTEPSSYVPTLRPEVIVGTELVKYVSWAVRREGLMMALIDTRAEAEYAGDKPGRGVKRAGHVPGARNVPYACNVLSDREPLMRSEEELRAAYEAAGARPGTRVVVYCRTGSQASLAYVALKMLGIEVALYDGSYIEWSADGELPVETSARR